MNTLRRHLGRVAAAPLLIAVIGSAELQAQNTFGTLEMTVRNAEDESPLAGAVVRVDSLEMGGITDRNGFVRISNLAPGSRRIEVRFLGYASFDDLLVIEAGRLNRFNVLLNAQPIELAEVVVTAGPALLASRGFYERRRVGQGTFFTREEIEEIDPRHMSDLLRSVSGVYVGASGFGPRPGATMRGAPSEARNCPIQYYLDGALTVSFNIDYVQPGDVEGLEIYRGSATVPTDYNRGNALCGVILIWTRVD